MSELQERRIAVADALNGFLKSMDTALQSFNVGKRDFTDGVVLPLSEGTKSAVSELRAQKSLAQMQVALKSFDIQFKHIMDKFTELAAHDFTEHEKEPQT